MAWGWLLLAILYLIGLFWIGRWGDSDSPLARKLTSHPATYSLALAIYCTAWTFFGAVGEASRNTWQYLPIMLGPILVYVLGYRFIYKLTLVSKKQHITTIADFISSRYGKRQTVALLVTIIALLATIPYVALQLKAIGSAFQLVSAQQNSELIVLLATIFIGLFSIYFGTQRADVTEYRRGLMLAIAFESTIKLVALGVVAVVGYFMWQANHTGSLLAKFSSEQAVTQFQSFPFIAQTIMAAAAIICLPRQFHVAVVDNLSLNHIKTARWLFPLYLALTALAIPIIAAVGQSLFAQSGMPQDTYVLNLAIQSDSLFVQLLVFVGGLSAATAMIIVATLTLSTMVTNDVILPKMLSLRGPGKSQTNYSKSILLIRRGVIAGLLLLAYLYHQQMGNSRSLASIGLIAFSLVIQLLPAILGGLYWKKGHAHGVYAGLLTGLSIWILWLIMPVLNNSANVQLHNDAISQVAMLSLAANFVAYGVFSHFAPSRLVDRIQAQAFVAPRESIDNQPTKPSVTVTVGDLTTLLSTFLGDARCERLIEDYQRRSQLQLHDDIEPQTSFIAFCERALGGVLGSSSAKALIDSVLSGKKLDFEEVVNFFDDTTQALKFNTSALFASIESLEQGISVVDKDLNLVAWNKSYLTFFNYPDGLVNVGTPIAELIRYNALNGECGVGDVDELVQKRLEHIRLGHRHRFLRQRSDGKMIETIGNPLPDGGYVTSFSDVTTHIALQEALKESNIDLEKRIKKRSEEVQAINAELRNEITRRADLEVALVNARKAAEDANASKTRFLALASHDILQPLNAAKLYLSALQEMQIPGDVSRIINKLGDSVTSSEALIATLLDIARLDQGEMKAEKSPHSIKKILAPLLDEFSMKANQKGLSFRARIQDLWVDTDKTYLYRIVQNLLSNAIKYSEKGKVLLTVRKQSEHVILQVWDTGVGISETEQTHIFADFYRVGDSQEHGVGLGLGVVARLSEKLAVPVSIASEKNKGSCFTVTIPLITKPAQKSSVGPVNQIGLKGLKVLCVDDKTENLDAMQTLLNKWQIDVYVAQNSQQAKTLMQQELPNVLLVDYHLGEEPDGLALINQLRELSDQYTAAALVTANQDSDIQVRCKRADVGYLAKPVKPAKLRVLLSGMLRKTG